MKLQYNTFKSITKANKQKKIIVKSPLVSLRTSCPQQKRVIKREVANIPTILFFFSDNAFD